MPTIYYEEDADLGLLKDRKVAIIGYGSQGHAHALNLKDSGLDVVVGLHSNSRSRAKAENDGLVVADTPEAARQADVVMILVPDTIQAEIYEKDIGPNLKEGSALAFAHGFNIHYELINPSASTDVFMIAPKGPGHVMRQVFVEGGGVPSLLAVHQDATGNAKSIALAYAKGIGATRAGVIETTFKEETETDLFGEQTVLCGGVTSLVKAGFETLVEAGYQPEIAFFECLHELKLIVDLFYEGGISRMWYSVSDTAEYGGLTRGPHVIGEETRKAMNEILEKVRSGEFAKEWIEEYKKGGPNFKRLAKEDAIHPIEKVGAELRSMMKWLPDQNQ